MSAGADAAETGTTGGTTGDTATFADLDARLGEHPEQLDKVALARIITDHDTPSGSRCPRCKAVTNRTRRSCPSREVAVALRDRRPLPAWLDGLRVPGVPPRIPAHPKPTYEETDALPGLFDPPARVLPNGRSTK